MALFVIELRGSYALEVKVVRAKDLAEALTLAEPGHPFDRIQAKELDPDGCGHPELFSTHYIE